MSDDQQRESESVADREERQTTYDEGEGERRESPRPEAREQEQDREREHEREREGDDERERDPLKLRSNRLSREEINELERTGHKLFVGNLSYETRVPDMEREFGKYGELKDVFLPMHRMTGQCRGFGFVTYATREGAEEAEKNLNGATMLGRVIAVNFARPRPSGGARRGGFRGRPYRPYFPRAPRYDYGYYSRGYDAYDDRRYPPAAPGAEAAGYYGYDRRDRYSPYDSRAPPPPAAPAGAPPPPAAEAAYDQRGGYYGSSYSYPGYDDRAYRSTTYEPPRRY